MTRDLMAFASLQQSLRGSFEFETSKIAPASWSGGSVKRDTAVACRTGAKA